VLSALALLAGGLLVALGVLAVAASAHQRGSGGAEVGLFCFIFAAPFLIVGFRGWRGPPRKRDRPAASAPAPTRIAPEPTDAHGRPLPFPPRQPPPAGADSATEEAER
jgi:hypothetical protein